MGILKSERERFERHFLKKLKITSVKYVRKWFLIEDSAEAYVGKKYG